ncbi:hypothetical protein KC343_g2204 [Hortaea werneckii]|nr:hypothetical protein KC338_g5579 [Hortaea werneckii]KAI7257202.1 hypothetical protein KC352_g11003 [Hortaea werneckii]KAI7570454.1 hypothetical protein KC317_g2456 [Hortaea werneckii]KAI7624747.1 hypothetical protein KC346_g2072 [Hortaea werneckii]KAI7634801.1 hypothetical protein KC343_g2204 [Hortaea werneckii]
MAFRLISDMGILNKTSTPNTHDPSEEHALGQLGWSCYLWDKAVSLYLGRMPSLPEPPMFEPTVLDGHIEYEQWSPYYGPEQHGNKMNNGNNLCHPTPALGATCFVNFCKLGPIIHEILATLYAKKPDPNMLPFVQTTMLRLETWRSESPAELRYDGRSTTCPPPHVLSQNMLFYSTTILLHRPFRANEKCRDVCTQASLDMEHLLHLLESTFGLTHVTYLMAYCAYIAATVAMLDLHDHIRGSQTRLNMYLRALYSARSSCPVIQRSIDIIVKAMEYRRPRQVDLEKAPIGNQGPTDPDPLPMFPFDEYNVFGTMDLQTQSTLPFGALDPFATDWCFMADDVFGQTQV